MVKHEQLKLIVEYCEHYDFHREIDRIPMPVPNGDLSKWITDQWELEFI